MENQNIEATKADSRNNQVPETTNSNTHDPTYNDTNFDKPPSNNPNFSSPNYNEPAYNNPNNGNIESAYTDTDRIIGLILAFFLPPLAVGLRLGFRGAFWGNIFLCLLFFFPGMFHALYVVLKK